MTKTVWQTIEGTLHRYIGNEQLIQAKKTEFQTAVPHNVGQLLDAIIADHKRMSYRDATLIQLAFALHNSGLDTTKRPEGARSIGGKLGRFLAQNHIPGREDAYQNIGKNTVDLARGNVPHFDAFLHWAAHAPIDTIQQCFEYVCARVAELARPVVPMPELNVARLTYAEVMAVFDELLQVGSQGAFEQYIIASLLETLVEQAGPPGYRVDTKALNASDRSAGTAADIQVWAGTTLIEAYEVTANDWATKLVGVSQKMKEHDLARIHIVAPLQASYGNVARELVGNSEDISVLDLYGFAASMVATLRRAGRNMALRRLYECLDRFTPVELVNRFVQVLVRRGLVHMGA